jgi:zinc transporter ZupT
VPTQREAGAKQTRDHQPGVDLPTPSKLKYIVAFVLAFSTSNFFNGFFGYMILSEPSEPNDFILLVAVSVAVLLIVQTICFSVVLLIFRSLQFSKMVPWMVGFAILEAAQAYGGIVGGLLVQNVEPEAARAWAMSGAGLVTFIEAICIGILHLIFRRRDKRRQLANSTDRDIVFESSVQ